MCLTAIGLGAAVLGGALSDNSQTKAAGKAADTTMAVARQNNALARENRDMLLGRADPFVSGGMGANALLNDFYGISPAGGQAMPTAQPAVPTNALMGGFGGTGVATAKPWMFEGHPNASGTMAQPWGVQAPQPTGQQPHALGVNSGDAFRRFIENSDYGFQFGEGANNINSGYAGAGVLQSGAAVRELEQFRQNLQSGYRGEWASGVSGQQGAGLNALGAAAGVSTNYVNQASNNNNNAGTARANAQLIAGQNNPFANALGMAGGFMLGR